MELTRVTHYESGYAAYFDREHIVSMFRISANVKLNLRAHTVINFSDNHALLVSETPDEIVDLFHSKEATDV